MNTDLVNINQNKDSSIDSGVSAIEPDWSRETICRWWDPSRQLIKSIRQYQYWQQNKYLGKLISKWIVIEYRFWSIVTGAEIPLNCQIGGGVVLRHPNGIVIHPSAVLGPNCMIFQQVTIVGGVRIGGHVDIGAGAKIIRSVSIGDHARIGANSVVLENIPSEATVAGVPARIIKKSMPSSY